MTIHFRCERCGHPIEVDDHLAGQRGHCKHCGHAEVVPSPEPAKTTHTAEEEPAFRLRPAVHAEAAPASVQPAHAGAPDPAFRLRPIEPQDPHVGRTAEPHLAPGTPPREPRLGESADPYPVLGGVEESTGWVRRPSTHGHPIARFLLNGARSLRNWLYVGSVLSLAVATCGFLFKLKLALHIGIALVIATNAGMLAVGLFYLVLYPFKEGVVYGVANILLPPYAIYYWVTRWPKMKGPVRHTLASFTPILLAVVGLLVYEEGPVVEKRVEAALPAVEKEIEEKSDELEKTIEGPAPERGSVR